MAINRTDLQFLDQAFRKLLTSTGIKEGLFENVFTDISNSEITNPLTLYVETTGNDENGTGTKNSPYKTIQKALDYLRNFKIKSQVDIQVGEGIFDGFVYPSYNADTAGPTASSVRLNGTMIPAKLTTGTYNGIITSGTSFLINDSTQSWTINELKGKFIKLSNSSTYGIIYSNTENSIIAHVGGATSGVGYEIFDIGTTIKCNVVGSPITATMGCILECNGNALASTTANIRYLKFDTMYGGYCLYLPVSDPKCYFSTCEFKVSSDGAANLAVIGAPAASGGNLVFSRCFFNLNKTNSGAVSILSMPGLNIYPINCYFLGSDKTQYAFDAGDYTLNYANASVFENLGYCFGSPLSTSSTRSSVNWIVMGTFINCSKVCYLKGNINILDSKLNLPTFTLSSTGNTYFIYIDKFTKANIYGIPTGLAVTDLYVNGETSQLSNMGPIFPSVPNAYGSCVFT